MRMRPWRKVCHTVALLSLMFVFAGCAQQRLDVRDDGMAGSNAPAALRAIKVSEDASLVEISADKHLTYTFYKLTSPPKVVIDLAQTEPGAVTAPIEVNAGNIKRIEVARHGFGDSVLSRIEVSLMQDGEFSVNADPDDKGKLLVAIAKPPTTPAASPESGTELKKAQPELAEENKGKGEEKQPVKVADATPLPATTNAKPEVDQAKSETKGELKASTAQKGKTLTGVKVVQDGVELTVPGGVDNFNSFKLHKPFRLVVDLIGVKSGMSAEAVSLNAFGINKARLGASPEKVRIVLDAQKDSLPPYQVVKSENGLKVLFKGATPAAPIPAVAETAKEPAKEPVEQKVAEAAKEPVTQKAEEAKTAKTKQPSVEAIDFKSAGEYSEITIKVSGDCKAEKPVKIAGGWALTIKNCQLPRRLQRMLDTGAFASPVLGITPYQVKVREGYDAKILIKMRSEEPFTFKQEGDVIHWNFKNPEVAKETPPAPAAVQKAKAAPAIEKQQPVTVLPDNKNGYSGRRVTLEFSDADVRKIFQLIAEVSNLNFLIADDVTGTISLKLVNVPWDQALDVILETKGLEKRQEGNILYIKPKGKFKTIEEEEAEAKKAREKRMVLKTRIFDVNFAAVADVASQFDKLKSERGAISLDTRTNRVIVTDIEDRLDTMAALLKELDLPEKQVMIEARIVEASASFSRDLGVQWGLHYKDGSASFLGINQLDTGFGGIVTAPPTSGTGATAGGAIGMSFGKLTSNVQLDLRLSAAASAGLVKIVSTPKVVTLNNKSAKISQGQSIPYQSTSAEGTKTEFIEAALTLDVTPHITADGNIGMKIKATNNSPGAVPQGANAPSINKKEATTELQVMNGETTVIGGIYVDNESESNTGVPFLMDIPLIGWLFKSNNKTKTKTELLIFITPRIVS